ncbi:hypothetical protein [Treponema sp. Marseille-Q4130]|uniref:hypothetical protein n=1 Tax=Treponema sp. Marseille-Q4130 TaxID=2766702 RepID=UPI001651EE65|nr:hypothetical protein [Treponema sp. Marseille-Q4130]MBC6720917.1 hypothetical protein [Treponema sp. Marseille-Q4130]
MMNEMNPKLKALIAAGLIGTAGLGMQSCSMPADSGVEVVVNDENTFEGLKVAPNDQINLARGHILSGTEEGERKTTILNANGLDNATFHYYIIGEGFKNEDTGDDTLKYYAYYRNNVSIGLHVYIIPISKKINFEKAIAAYKAGH